MPMKATMQFTLGRASFTESHYSRVYTDPTSAGAQAAAVRLATLRINLLGAGCALTRLRLSRTDIPRFVVNVDLTGVKLSNLSAVPQDTPTDADIPNVSAIARADDQNGHAKNLYLAGIPEGAVQISSAAPLYFEWTGILANAWKAYIFELQTSWNFRVGNPIAPRTQVQLVVNTITPIPAVNLTIITPLTGQPAQPPFSVYLNGFRRNNTRLPNLSGVYEVVAVSPPITSAGPYSLTLAETGDVQGTNFTRLGTAAVQAYSYVPYVNLSITKSGTRKRGGSAGLPRGRSRTRA